MDYQSRFDALWMLFISVFICGSAREWICYIKDAVCILKWTAKLNRLSEYLATDILYSWILNRTQDTGIVW